MENLKKYLELKNVSIKSLKANKTNGPKCYTLIVESGNDSKAFNALNLVLNLTVKTYAANIFHITLNN